MLRIDEKSINLARWRFQQATKQRGLGVVFYKPKNKAPGIYNEWTETSDEFEKGKELSVLVYNIQDKTQRTVKKFGWVKELDTTDWVIEIAYDIPIEVGAVITLPSGLSGEHEPFRIAQINNIPQYPISFMCALAPVYKQEEIQSEGIFKNLVVGGEDD